MQLSLASVVSGPARGARLLRGSLIGVALVSGLLPATVGAANGTGAPAKAPTFNFADSSFDLLWTRTSGVISAWS
jgi:hypothetical protein